MSLLLHGDSLVPHYSTILLITWSCMLLRRLLITSLMIVKVLFYLISLFLKFLSRSFINNSRSTAAVVIFGSFCWTILLPFLRSPSCRLLGMGIKLVIIKRMNPGTFRLLVRLCKEIILCRWCISYLLSNKAILNNLLNAFLFSIVMATKTTVNSKAAVVTSYNYILIKHLYLVACNVLMIIEMIWPILTSLLVACM